VPSGAVRVRAAPEAANRGSAGFTRQIGCSPNLDHPARPQQRNYASEQHQKPVDIQG